MGESETAHWREQRSAAVHAHAEALRRQHERETAQARELIDEFLNSAKAQGLPAEPLRARRYRGSGTVRTHLVGWYLKHNRTVGLDTDGNYYVLTAEGGILDRLRGARVEPTDPPLIVGRGGKDGESIPLEELLERLLGHDRDDG